MAEQEKQEKIELAYALEAERQKNEQLELYLKSLGLTPEKM
jgi:hypothetical protein